jgi:two-component system sensor histidine kinase KdpD
MPAEIARTASYPRSMDERAAPRGASDARGHGIPILARLARTNPHLRTAGFVVAIVGTAVVTLGLLPVRDSIEPLSKSFGFLIVVVASAAVGGLAPGIVASILGFLLFNYFFIPPYGTFTIARPEHVVVLFVFLGLSVLISELLARASERARAAEQREAELETIQDLSRELTTRVPGHETYEIALTTVKDTFGYSAASLFVEQTEDVRGLVQRVTVGEAPEAVEATWDPASADRPPERLPLSVGGRMLGLVVLKGDRPPLTPAESRVLRAFCDQLALVLERDRLLRSATQAEVYRQTETVRRSLFVAVSHDLRSPLSAIKASVTDLLDDVPGTSDADRKEALEAIDAETDRLNALIGNLLDMSRIESGALRARIQTVDLAETIAEAVDRGRRQRPEVGFSIRVASGAEWVRADPVFLDRVLSNLLENAAAASMGDAATPLEVDARPVDGSIVVRVIDHGPGVPASAREQLFYPFYRVDERNPRLGSGLGLAICKGFVTLLEGDIWIEDTPGGGATLSFTLPSADGIADGGGVN